MTTIDPDKRIQPTPEPKKGNGRFKTQKGSFNAVFQQALDPKAEETIETAATAFASDIRPAQFAEAPQRSTHMVVDRLQRLIDTMAVYQKKLTETGVTLKEMHPLVQQMRSQSESLAAVSETVEESDNLTSIVNQSLMLSSMERARYNSGYYND